MLVSFQTSAMCYNSKELQEILEDFRRLEQWATALSTTPPVLRRVDINTIGGLDYSLTHAIEDLQAAVSEEENSIRVSRPSCSRTADVEPSEPAEWHGKKIEFAKRMAARLRELEWCIVPVYYQGRSCLAHNLIIRNVLCWESMSEVATVIGASVATAVFETPEERHGSFSHDEADGAQCSFSFL
jgi:hypothetical protein